LTTKPALFSFNNNLLTGKMAIGLSAKNPAAIKAWISQILPPNISGNSQYDGKKAIRNSRLDEQLQFPETLYSSGFQDTPKWVIFFLARRLAI
jgi:hypothetical protein